VKKHLSQYALALTKTSRNHPSSVFLNAYYKKDNTSFLIRFFFFTFILFLYGFYKYYGYISLWFRLLIIFILL